MNFKLWSELNPKAKKELKPDFGFRNWDSLCKDEKYKIWKYLDIYFFDKDIKTKRDVVGVNKLVYYEFYGTYEKKNKRKRELLFR